MVDKDRILIALDDNFLEESRKHQEHKLRVEKAIDWFNSNQKSKSEKDSGFVGSRVFVNNVECLCTYCDLRGAPFYNANIEVRPLSSNEDAGSGAGMRHVISF